MPKIRDFIKKHPYIPLNVIGAVLVLLTFFSESVAAVGFSLVFAFGLVFANAAGIIAGIVFAASANAFAFVSVKNNEPMFGVVFSVLGGCIGGFAAVRAVRKDYARARAVGMIFNAYVWLAVYAAAAFLLYRFGYYHTFLLG